jgi:hypothetical protein
MVLSKTAVSGVNGILWEEFEEFQHRGLSCFTGARDVAALYANELSDALGFGLYPFPIELQHRFFLFRKGVLASGGEGIRVSYYVDEGNFSVMGAVVAENSR